MLLDKQEALWFHQAIGDPLRIDIIRLLQEEWRSGAVLARKLAVAPATMSHHLTKLRAIGILKEQRWGRAVYYRLDREKFLSTGQLSLRWMTTSEGVSTELFFNEDGVLLHWPAKRAEQYTVMTEVCRRLEADAEYGDDAMLAFAKGFYESNPWAIIGAGMQHWMFVRIAGGYLVQPESCWRK